MVLLVDLKTYAGKTIAGFVLGIGLNRGLRWVMDRWRIRHGLPPLSPATVSVPALESSALVIGAINYESPVAPFVIGVSSGKITDQYLPIVKGIFSRDEDSLGKGSNWDIHEVRIRPPMFLLNSREYMLEEVGKQLRKMVVQNTYNRTTKKWVPAGYKHPLVIFTAKNILRDANVRGDNPVEVAKAINQWTRDHVPYCFDPQGIHGDEDYFWHPARILESMEEKSGKTLCMDCDCSAILTASMLMALGYSPAFLIFAQKDPHNFNHVIAAMLLPKKEKFRKIKTYPYYPIETTRPEKPIDHMPRYKKRAVIEIIPRTVRKR